MQHKLENSLCCFALIGLLAAPATLLADEWSQYRGPNRDGVWPSPVFADEKVDELTLQERWRQPIGSGYSGVAIADGRLFTLSSDETHNLVLAIDAATGDELWRTTTDAVFDGGPGAMPGPSSTPAVDGGLVFALTPGGRLLALSTTDGEVRWRRDLEAELGAEIPTYGMATSPLLRGDQIVVQAAGEKAYLAAFKAATGELAWTESHGSGSSYGSPLLVTIEGVEQIVTASGEKLYAVDASDGSLLWTYALENAGMVDRMPLAIPGHRIFLPLTYTGGQMLEIRRIENDAKVSWQVDELWQTPRLTRNTHAPPIYHDGYLYGLNGSLLTCISADDGGVQWRQRVYDGTLTLVASHLVVMSAGSGKLHLVRATPDGFEQTMVTDLLESGDHTVTPPSYADQTIFVRNVEQLVALELRPGSKRPRRVADQAAPPAPDRRTQDGGLRELWRYPLASDIHPAGDAGLAIAGGRVFTLAADAKQEFALALHARSGKELWRTALDPVVEDGNGPRSTPAVADGRLFALSSACRLRAIGTDKGDVLWQLDLPAELGTNVSGSACQSSPRLIDGRLIVLTGNEEGKRVVALEPSDGSRLWTVDGLAWTTNASPVGAKVDGTWQVLANGVVRTDEGPRSLLYSLRLADGEALWSFQAEMFYSWLDPVVVDDTVLLPTWRQTYLLKPPSESPSPRTPEADVPKATEGWRYAKTLDGAVHRQGVYYAYQDDDLIAVRASDGQELWREKTFFGQLALADDQLLVLGYKTGRLRLVDASPDGYRETASRVVLNPGADNVTKPAFSAGIIYVRNQEELVAVAPGSP